MSLIESLGGAAVGALAKEAVTAIVNLIDDDTPEEATAELVTLAQNLAGARPEERAALIRKAALMIASEQVANVSMDAALKAHKKLT
jgi:hypothetical protein